MKKVTLLIVFFIPLLCAAPSIAADEGQPGQVSGMTFEQRKAAMLTRIDERISRLQEARTCVSGAATPEALRSCMGRPGGQPRQGHPPMGQ
jgi:hypothetical protein